MESYVIWELLHALKTSRDEGITTVRTLRCLWCCIIIIVSLDIRATVLIFLSFIPEKPRYKFVALYSWSFTDLPISLARFIVGSETLWILCFKKIPNYQNKRFRVTQTFCLKTHWWWFGAKKQKESTYTYVPMLVMTCGIWNWSVRCCIVSSLLL